MTIMIPQPSMALNAVDIRKVKDDWRGVPWIGARDVFPKYMMWENLDVPDSMSDEIIIDMVVAAARRAPDGYLRVVVINAHGTAAFVHLGGMTFIEPVLTTWRGKVANIWIQSCRLVTAYPDPSPRLPPELSDGNLLCSALAKLTGAYVVASSARQSRIPVPMAFGEVPNWDGPVFRYEPEHGSVDWYYDYGRGLAPVSPPPIAAPPGFRKSLGGAQNFWTQEWRAQHRRTEIHWHRGLL